MRTAPYTITIVQIKESVLIVDIQRAPTALPVEVYPKVGFQIIVEGYWALKSNYLDSIPSNSSVAQLLEATPYQRQLNYWRQLLYGQEEQLSLKESQQLNTFSEPELKALLRKRQVHSYGRQGAIFLLYRNPKPLDFERFAQLLILGAESTSDTQYRFQVRRPELLAHLTEGLSWGTQSFVLA